MTKKYLVIRFGSNTKLTPELLAERIDIMLNEPVEVCNGEDLYYGFETMAESLDKVAMIDIGKEDEE